MSGPARREWRRDPLLVLVLSGSTFLGALDGQVFAPILPHVAADLGVPLAAVGQFVTASALAGMLMTFLIGPLSDRYGRRPVLLVALAILALGGLAAALAPTYGLLLVVRLGAGVGSALLFPTAIASVADFLAPRLRAPAMGWVVGASGVAVVAGWPAIALITSLWGWRAALAALAVLFVGLMAAVRVIVPPPAPPAERAISATGHLGRYRAALGDRAVLLAVPASGLGAASWFGLTTYLGAYFFELHGVEPVSQAPLFAVLGVGYFVASIGGGVAAGRLGVKTVAIATALGSAAVLFALAGARADVAASVGLTVALGILRGSGLTAMNSWVVGLRPAERGTVAALNSGVFAVGVALGAGLGGAALAAGGFALLHALLGLLALTSAALLLWVRAGPPGVSPAASSTGRR